MSSKDLTYFKSFVIIDFASYFGDAFNNEGFISLTLQVNLLAFSFFSFISSMNLLFALSGIAKESSNFYYIFESEFI